MHNPKEVTIQELRKIFNENKLEYLIRTYKGCVAEVVFLIKEEEDVDTLDCK